MTAPSYFKQEICCTHSARFSFLWVLVGIIPLLKSFKDPAMFDILEHPKAVVVSTFVLLFLTKRYIDKKKRGGGYPLPPGPKGYPIIGNLFDIPGGDPWKGYSSLAKQYGDMVYLEALGNKILVLSSLKRTTDLLESRSTIYSDRPRFHMLAGQLEYDAFFGTRAYGPLWRQQRRTFHQHFNPTVVHRYHQSTTYEAAKLMKDLVSSPDKFGDHARAYLNRIIAKSTYALDSRSPDLEMFLKKAQVVANAFSEAAIPGRFMIDLIPALKYVPRWMPGTGWRKWADHFRQKGLELRVEPFEDVLDKMRKGTAEPCVATRLIENLPPADDPRRAHEEMMARDCAASVYLAGSDTTLGVAITFILIMAMYPEVQKRVQEEIDRVVGDGQIPTFEDRPNLVHVQALIKELLRWYQILPLAIPHASTQDDVYDGYFIPKGTIVIGNTWHIMHDETSFTDPFEFKPERYLKDDKINKDILDSFSVAFGYGRRICPGRHTALDSLYTIVVSLLSMFNIEPPRGEDGKTNLHVGFSGILLLVAEPFDCVITPRSARHEQLINSMEY